MLLNRKRVKFWQKIVFGFMAALMASFLIFGYSGIASGCSHRSSLNSGNSALDSQLKADCRQCRIIRLGAKRVGLAREFLRQKIEPPAGRAALLQESGDRFEMRA